MEKDILETGRDREIYILERDRVREKNILETGRDR